MASKPKHHRGLSRPAVLGALGVVAICAFIVLRQSDAPHDEPSGPTDTNTLAGDSATASNKPGVSPSGVDRPAGSEIPVGDGAATSVHDEWQQLDDPSKDGWDTEAFNLKASKQFKILGELLAQPEQLASAGIESLVSADYRGGDLVPSQATVAFRDKTFLVERLPKDSSASDGATPSGHEMSHVGRDGFRQSIRALTDRFQNATDFRSKFKIFQVESGAATAATGRMTTRQYVELSGRLPSGLRELHATWQATWQIADNGTPLLSSIQLVDFEQTGVEVPTGSLFTDCTRSVLAHNDCYAQQLLSGLAYWLARTQNTRSFTSLGNPGIALGDVNGDGLDDLYLCQEQGIPNRLFLQRADGTLDDVSREWQVDWLQNSRSALIVDIDNDGDQDLVVAHLGGVAIASNESNQRYQLRTVLATSDDQMSISAADYDSDGDLDLYAAAYYPDRFLGESSNPGVVPESAGNFVLHDANTGGRNSLHRNDISADDWTFTDVTEAVGLDVNNSRLTFAPAWDDYDNDGDQDLYVANDFGRDNFYRNDGGHFSEISDTVGAEDSATGMGTAWGDFDRDGWMDVHVSNMWSSAGGRITFQPKFKSTASAEAKRRLQRLARGNTLLQNNGQGQFRDVSAAANVEMGRWAWASQFADINNDAWEDIIVCNGYITGDESGGDL